MSTRFDIIDADWQLHADALGRIRRAVFIEEQQVPEELEWDEHDANSFHVLALATNGEPMGTGRLKNDGQIGRMAVSQAWRGQGIGSAILQRLVAQARTLGMRRVYLHAQTSAIDFYRRFGFGCEGDVYLEAGIPHQNMTLDLD